MKSHYLKLPYGVYALLLAASHCFCPVAVASLPPGWTDVDIGSPTDAGSATDNNGLWTVAGGGADIWNEADQFNFASENVTGDGSIMAEVLTVQNTDPGSGWSKAGVMFRNDTSAGAVNAAVVVTPGNGVSFQWRNTVDGSSSYINVTGLTAPIWVALTRSGSNYSAFYSASGQNWTQVGSTQAITMSSNNLAGLAVSAHNDSDLNTSTFTNVSVEVAPPVISLPIITNLPVVNIQATAATLTGQVISTGNQNPLVTIFYGPTDGGTNVAVWANNIVLGQQSGIYAFTVTGLATNTIYYFTAMATNAAGSVWASTSKAFTTLSSSDLPTQNVTTYQYDNTRAGADTNEFLLTPANVNVNNFGRLFTYPVDGYVFAQALVVTNVTIPDKGEHDVLYVVTENDTVYAFDADNYVPTPYWTNSFIDAAAGIVPVPGAAANGNIQPEVGITATPVIDPAKGTLYVEARTQETSGTNVVYVHRLHALDIGTGQERTNYNSPVVISDTNYPGTGTPGQNDTDGAGHILWNGVRENCRPALLLANGMVYLAYASPGDHPPYYGWVFAYDAHTLEQKGVFNDDPNAGYGGIWMTGNGMAADTNGNVYLNTGNGTYDTNDDYGDSVLKFNGTNGLTLSDYFTPSDQAMLSSQDLDISSAGLLLLPNSVGTTNHPHLLLSGSKTGTLYLLDRDNMGKYNSANDNQIVQELSGAVGGMWCSPAYFNGNIYIIGNGDFLKSFTISNATMGITPTAQSSTEFGSATPTISANGTNNAIVWAMGSSGGSAILYAFNATNVAQELYNSSQNFTRDNPGSAVEFTLPTVANGKVYVGAQYALSVFGNGIFLDTPTITPDGGIFTNSVTVTLSDTTPNTVIYFTLDGTTPTTNSILYTEPFELTNSVLVIAGAFKTGAVASGTASASFINSSAIGDGTGLLGQYWANTSSTAFITPGFDTPPTLTRVDPTVNFNWDVTNPAIGIGPDTYVVQWTGSVEPQFDETYTFYTTTDDGGMLWVNGQQLINEWADESPTTWSGQISLKAQQRYNITMDYYQDGGGAVAQLCWSSPSTGPMEIIPQSQLYPVTNPPPSVIMTGPTNGASYTASASVTLTADAAAQYNSLASVGFYANSTFLGSVSNLPYMLTATGLAAGNYALTAVVTDGSGLTGTSAPVNISVNPGTGQPYGLTGLMPSPAFFNMPMAIPATLPGSVPPLLSMTGVFSNTPEMIPTNGLIPYNPNVQLWSDGAVKTRYLSVPNVGSPLTSDEQIAFAPTGSWTFPAGTVFVKTFQLQTNQSNPNSLHRLETRLLVRDINGAVYGVTYKWRPDNSDADLLTTSSNENIAITTSEGVVTQTWYYPSPSDCLTCHTPMANYVLGVNTRQLNAILTYPSTGVADNQLRTLNRLGLFNPAIDESSISNFEALSALTNLTASLQQRARSYIDANCAQCHQPGGTGPTFDARYDTPLVNQNITNYPALFSLGNDEECIVRDNDIWRSSLYARMNIVDPNSSSGIQMPPLARNLIDTNAISVMGAWIDSLPGIPALAPPTISPNGGTFASSVAVTLQSTNTSAALYYTLDGTLPTTNSFLYSGPFVLTNNTTVTANAFETNFKNSVGVSAMFTVRPLIFFTSENFTASNVFQLEFSGVTNNNYVLEATTNFVNWVPLNTNMSSTNPFSLVDPNATNFPYRFYRVLQQ